MKVKFRSNIIHYDCMGSPLRLCIVDDGDKTTQMWLDTEEENLDQEVIWTESEESKQDLITCVNTWAKRNGYEVKDNDLCLILTKKENQSTLLRIFFVKDNGYVGYSVCPTEIFVTIKEINKLKKALHKVIKESNRLKKQIKEYSKEFNK